MFILPIHSTPKGKHMASILCSISLWRGLEKEIIHTVSVCRCIQLRNYWSPLMMRDWSCLPIKRKMGNFSPSQIIFTQCHLDDMEDVRCFCFPPRDPAFMWWSGFCHLSLLSVVKWEIRENPQQFIYLTSGTVTEMSTERKTQSHFCLMLHTCLMLRADLCF